MADKIKAAIAVLLLIAGHRWGSISSRKARWCCACEPMLAGLAAGAAVGWTTAPGKEFFVFAQEAVVETKKGGVADPQGVAADGGGGVRFRGGDGGVSLDHRQAASNTDVRPATRMEEVTMTANATKRWYVVHAYSGFEKSRPEGRCSTGSAAPECRRSSARLLVPTEEVVEMQRRAEEHLRAEILSRLRARRTWT